MYMHAGSPLGLYVAFAVLYCNDCVSDFLVTNGRWEMREGEIERCRRISSEGRLKGKETEGP